MRDEEPTANAQALTKDTYERYCREIDKEDNLIDQRLNWLIASQSLLFAALSLSDKPITGFMVWIIPIVGMGVSFVVGESVRGAVASLNQYRNNLIKACPKEWDKEKCFPQLHRDQKNLYRGLVSPRALPWLFLGAWTVVLLMVLINFQLE